MPAEDPADPRPLEVLATLRFGRWPTALYALAFGAGVLAAMTGWFHEFWWGAVAMALIAVPSGAFALRRYRLLEVTTWDLRFVHIGRLKHATIPWHSIASLVVTRRTIVVRNRDGVTHRVPRWLGDSQSEAVLAALLREAEAHGVRVRIPSSVADPAA